LVGVTHGIQVAWIWFHNGKTKHHLFRRNTVINNEESEQNVIRAVLACLIVYLLYISFLAPPPPLPPEPAPVEATTEQAKDSTPSEISADSTVKANSVEEGLEASVDSGEKSLPSEPVFVEPEPWSIELESPEAAKSSEKSKIPVKASLRSQGGGLSEMAYMEYKAPISTQPIWSYLFGKMRGSKEAWLPYGEEPGPEKILTEEGLFLASGANLDFEIQAYELISSTPQQAVVQRKRKDGLQITKTYAFSDDAEILDIKVEFKNTGTSLWSGPVWVGSVDVFGGSTGRYSSVARPAMVADESLSSLDDIEDVETSNEMVEGPVSWFGIQDRYFMVAAMPQTPDWGRGVFAATKDNKELAGAFLVKDGLTLQPGEPHTLTLQVYMGTKELSKLNARGNHLNESVSFGFFGFVSLLLLKVMVFFQGYVGNWGMAIICLTITMKTLFFPLTKKSFVSSRKMQALAPKMKDLKERYKDNPQQMGQAQMKLFREEGVNPLAGCLPMLIQMPVWFALYSVLLSSAPLYQADFLFIEDLTSRDPYGVLPTLVGVAMFVQQRITPMSPNADPMQQKIFRMLPFFFVFIMYAFPSGLALYILVNTLFSIGQMAAVNKAFPMPKAV
jgi:YidC/Oxa1 family membrane protein insertase